MVFLDYNRKLKMEKSSTAKCKNFLQPVPKKTQKCYFRIFKIDLNSALCPCAASAVPLNAVSLGKSLNIGPDLKKPQILTQYNASTNFLWCNHS